MVNYLLDIDGTITADVPNEEFERMSDVVPFKFAVEAINTLYDQGHCITFFTSRTEEMREVTEIWLKKWGFKYHGMIMNKPRGGDYIWIDNLDVVAVTYKRHSHFWKIMLDTS